MKILSHKPHNLLLKKVNPLLKFMVISDMLIVGSLGMFSSFYALFVEDNIVGADELAIGISLSLYLLSKSILQIPVATILDKIKGEKDDYFTLIAFSFGAALLYLSYLKVTEVWQLYLLQILMGFTTAATYPSFMAIFTRHMDRHMEGTEWGIYYTFVDLSGAAMASMGGYIAHEYGLRTLVVVVAALCIFGAAILIPIKAFTNDK